MRLIGQVVTAIVGLAALAGIAVGVRSAPDVQRYRRMRAM